MQLLVGHIFIHSYVFHIPCFVFVNYEFKTVLVYLKLSSLMDTTVTKPCRIITGPSVVSGI